MRNWSRAWCCSTSVIQRGSWFLWTKKLRQRWFQSNKRNRGEVHLLMHLSTSDKSHEETLKDHRRLLRILLSFELLQRKCQPFEWKDNFSKETLQILAQHAVQVSIDFGLFKPILTCLVFVVESGENSDEIIITDKLSYKNICCNCLNNSCQWCQSLNAFDNGFLHKN